MIREFRPKDLDDVLTVWEAASRVGHPFLTPSFLASERLAVEREHLPSAETWVWERERRVAGFIALVGDFVGGLFVAPELHGEGIGSALLEHAKRLRRELQVEVFEENHRARRFYDRHGFERTDRKVHGPTGLGMLCLVFAAERGDP